MVSVKELGAERDIVKVVVVVPMRRFCVRVGEVRLKTGFPVPVRLTLDVPLADIISYDETSRTSARVGGGESNIESATWLTASEAGLTGQLLVSLKSPVVVMLVIVRGGHVLTAVGHCHDLGWTGCVYSPSREHQSGRRKQHRRKLH